MKKLLSIIILIIIPQYVSADSTEISIFSGYRFGGELHHDSTGSTLKADESSSVGIMIGGEYDKNSVLEVMYTRQPTRLTSGNAVLNNSLYDVDVSYLHIGGSLIWDEGSYDTFFSGGIGGTQLAPERIGVSSTTRLSMSFAGGAVYKVTKNIGLRLEVRAYITNVPKNDDVFCQGTNCEVVSSGLFSQVDLNAGLRFKFK